MRPVKCIKDGHKMTKIGDKYLCPFCFRRVNEEDVNTKGVETKWTRPFLS